MRRVLLAALILAGLAAPAPAGNTGLDRLTLRDDLLGWEAVGRIDLGAGGFCSGVLIAPDLVLTAAHCLAEARAAGAVDAITFRAGLRDGVAVAEAKAARAVIHPDYRPGAGVTQQNVAADVGLIELAAAMPASTAAPFPVQALPGSGAAVSVVSYGAGRAEAPSRQAVCTVTGRGQTLAAFDCDVTFGSSGAPVFDLSGPRARVVSLVSSAGGGRAFGMALPEAVSTLRHAFATGAGVFPQPGFSARRLAPGSRGTGAKFVRPGGS